MTWRRLFVLWLAGVVLVAILMSLAAQAVLE